MYESETAVEVMPEDPSHFLQVGMSAPYERRVSRPTEYDSTKEVFTPQGARTYHVYHHKQEREGNSVSLTVPTEKMNQFMRRVEWEDSGLYFLLHQVLNSLKYVGETAAKYGI
jgi:hypothetical protein